MSIPFENLDIGRSIRISLNKMHLYQKIVTNGRGGFCFELNSLFGCLLESLNFSVTFASARVFNADQNKYGPEFDHLILLVDLDKRYLVDVGFGDSFSKPFPLPHGRQTDIHHGTYRLNTLSSPDIYVVQRQAEKGWQPLFRFAETPRKLSDFNAMCTYHQTSPDSHFTRKSICTLATPEGRKTLTDTDLIITEGKKKMKFPVSSSKEFHQMLNAHFHIQLRY
jgi:N-hydroxyarylamine O-acetyltransferase